MIILKSKAFCGASVRLQKKKILAGAPEYTVRPAAALAPEGGAAGFGDRYLDLEKISGKGINMSNIREYTDRNWDLIVVGGGLSGVAAAVAAGREGLSVLLIEKGGFLGGAPEQC